MSAPAAITPDAGPVVPEWTLGDRLRKIRRLTGDGQAEFAGKLGTNQKSYAAWELDYNSPRNLVALAKRIETLTGVPAAWVLGVDYSAANRPAIGAANPGKPTVSAGVVLPFPEVKARGTKAVRSAVVRTREVTGIAS